MDELTIEGKVYLSSKRAAKVTGYAKDYVGQLCREGRVEAKLVGRSWYVYEPSIQEHRFNDERSKGKGKSGAAEVHEKSKNLLDESNQSSENTNIQAVWERPTYSTESFETFPVVAGVDTGEVVKPSTESPQMIGEMQSAWQEWFAGQQKPKQEPIAETPAEETQNDYRYTNDAVEETYETPVQVYTRKEPEVVPMRTVVSDIAPRRDYSEPEVVRMPVYRQEVPTRTRAKAARERHSSVLSPRIVKALLTGVIVVSIAVAVIATGFIEQLHIGGVFNSAGIEYLQGSSVLNK